ncbi:MAG: type II secretion system protein, partial [Rhodopirellula sp.]|nr:type II secretion system protein [Rhodopirellula sp.]
MRQFPSSFINQLQGLSSRCAPDGLCCNKEQPMSVRRQFSRGFTLIELLVVIAIIA